MKRYIIRAISLFFSILMAGVIFSFSADTAEESKDLSSEVTETVLSAVGVDKETMPSEEYEEVKMKTEFLVRKLAHFTEYFLFGVCLCTFFSTYKIKKWLFVLLTMAVATPYAALDEWHQAFVPGRGPGVRDVMIDSAGAFCGALLVFLIYMLIMKRLQKADTV